MSRDPKSISPTTSEFAIVETDNGMTVVMLEAGKSAQQTALAAGGVLVDAGPYRSYEVACDAIVDLMEEDREDEKT